MFATGSYDHAVIIWETETGQKIHTLKGTRRLNVILCAQTILQFGFYSKCPSSYGTWEVGSNL